MRYICKYPSHVATTRVRACEQDLGLVFTTISTSRSKAFEKRNNRTVEKPDNFLLNLLWEIFQILKIAFLHPIKINRSTIKLDLLYINVPPTLNDQIRCIVARRASLLG